MNFGFLAASQLWWAALAPLLIVFYLMKLRRQEKTVSALFLWRQATQEARVDAFFQRLRNNLLLWLQILILLLLALALARPYRPSQMRLANQIALVLDGSASMGARHPAGGTRFGQAIEKAREVLKSAPSGSQVLLALQADRPRIIVPFTSDVAAARRQLERLQPSELEELADTLQPFVVSLKRSNPQAQVLVFSDHKQPGLSAEVRDCGGPSRNLALQSFQIGPQAFVVVQSFSNAAEVAVLSLRDGNRRELARRTLPLQAGGRRAVSFDLPESPTKSYELRLETEDDFDLDNHQYAVFRGGENKRVTLVGEVDPFLQKALEAQEGLQLRRVATATERPDDSDVTVWAEPPEKLPPGSHILEGPPLAWRGKVTSAARMIAEPGSMAEDLGVGELALGRYWKLKSPVALTKLVSSPDGDPLIALIGQDALLFTLDLNSSELPLSPAFPILLQRFLDRSVYGTLGQLPSSLRCGETLQLRTSNDVRLGTTVVRSERGRVAYTCENSGLFRLDVGKEQTMLAVNFQSTRESSLQESPGKAEAGGQGGGTELARGEAREEIWSWVAWGCILVLLAEWFLYYRGSRPLRDHPLRGGSRG